VGATQVSDCSDAMARRWAYLDHEVDQMTCAELEAHLEACAHCKGEYVFDQRFKARIRRCIDAGPVPDDRIESIKARLRAELERGAAGP